MKKQVAFNLLAALFLFGAVQAQAKSYGQWTLKEKCQNMIVDLEGHWLVEGPDGSQAHLFYRNIDTQLNNVTYNYIIYSGEANPDGTFKNMNRVPSFSLARAVYKNGRCVYQSADPYAITIAPEVEIGFEDRESTRSVGRSLFTRMPK